jgi:hypothetical protein
MGYYRNNLSRLGAPGKATIEPVTFPAPVGGMNALDSVMGMPITDCIYAFNTVPSEYGLRLRKAYREWATGADGDVRTLLNYESNVSVGGDILWAVTENGIYDVTVEGTTAPVEDVAFTNQDPGAGYGVSTEFTNDAAEHYLFYADYRNGIHQYEDGVGWSVPVGWTYDPTGNTPETQLPFPVEDVAFVMVHKLRIWVILEDSDDAWYLPIASVAGVLLKFTFGAKLPHGGRLMGLWDWTVDGGNGIDDYLIALSKSGDLIVYRGDDPEGATWQVVGSWFVGQATQSRRCASQYGAELYILSSYGITSIRDLLQGSDANIDRTSPSAKIARFLRTDIASGIDKYEWSIELNPSDSFLQIVAPEPTNTPYVQYVQNVATKGWGLWEGVPMICGNHWQSEYYMGGKDGVVYIYDGALDGVDIAATNPGEPVTFRSLTSFQSPDGHSSQKRVNNIRPIGITNGQSTVSVEAVYDYNVEAETLPPAPTPGQQVGVWNSSLWGNAVWPSTTKGSSEVLGGWGVGRAFAIATAGSSSTRITIVGWDVFFTRGGLL